MSAVFHNHQLGAGDFAGDFLGKIGRRQVIVAHPHDEDVVLDFAKPVGPVKTQQGVDPAVNDVDVRIGSVNRRVRLQLLDVVPIDQLG